MAGKDLRFSSPLDLSHPVALRFAPPDDVTVLVFSEPLDTSHPVNLRFVPAGEVAPPQSKELDVSIAAVLPSPSIAAVVRNFYVFPVSASAVLPPPVMTAAIGHDNAVYRGPNGHALSGWQVGEKAPVVTAAPMQQGQKMPVGTAQPWQRADRVQASTAAVASTGISVVHTDASPWESTAPVGNTSTGRHAEMIRLRGNRRVVPWRHATPAGGDRASDWQDRIRAPRPTQRAPWGKGTPAGIDRSYPTGEALRHQLGRDSDWQEGRKPPPGRYVVILPPGPRPGDYVPPAGGAVDLLFEDAFQYSTDILFTKGRDPNQPKPAVIVPVRRTYIVINDVHLKRVEGNVELPTYSLALKIDMESWTWGFDASLPAHLLSDLQPGGPGTPVEIEAVINGTAYRLLVENIARSRTFGKSSLSVSGRGRSAVLADPFSPILQFNNATERTAQQLMNDALTTNGVSLGWDLDWMLEDWLVPAGTWNHSGTYMSAVNAIANAAGGFIQPDPSAQILRVRPRYAKAPWEWGTSAIDVELPASVVTVEGVRWVDYADYNAVFVSGTTSGGVLGHIKRGGTAGDKAAPMVTDSLITDVIAARQRGIEVLSRTGRVASYSLSLPVLAETGVIEPGTMVRYVDAGNPVTGVVKGVSVQSTHPSVRQTIELETHA